MDGKPVTTDGIRIVELPPCIMASSEGHSLDEFDAWWSVLDGMRKDRFFPRDFMYFDTASGGLVWLYALTSFDGSDPGFPTVEFLGGLYAASVSIDGDDVDGERVYAEVKGWVGKSGCFRLDESAERPTLFHVITSDRAFSKLGYRQLDIYVPILEAEG